MPSVALLRAMLPAFSAPFTARLPVVSRVKSPPVTVTAPRAAMVLATPARSTVPLIAPGTSAAARMMPPALSVTPPPVVARLTVAAVVPSTAPPPMLIAPPPTSVMPVPVTRAPLMRLIAPVLVSETSVSAPRLPLTVTEAGAAAGSMMTLGAASLPLIVRAPELPSVTLPLATRVPIALMVLPALSSVAGPAMLDELCNVPARITPPADSTTPVAAPAVERSTTPVVWPSVAVFAIVIPVAPNATVPPVTEAPALSAMAPLLAMSRLPVAPMLPPTLTALGASSPVPAPIVTLSAMSGPVTPRLAIVSESTKAPPVTLTPPIASIVLVPARLAVPPMLNELASNGVLITPLACAMPPPSVLMSSEVLAVMVAPPSAMPPLPALSATIGAFSVALFRTSALAPPDCSRIPVAWMLTLGSTVTLPPEMRVRLWPSETEALTSISVDAASTALAVTASRAVAETVSSVTPGAELVPAVMVGSSPSRLPGVAAVISSVSGSNSTVPRCPAGAPRSTVP